ERIPPSGAGTAQRPGEPIVIANEIRAPGVHDDFTRDRLCYVLPDFTRVSWVSDRARETWEPRIQRIGTAWAELEWRSVIAGVRRCALTSVSAEQLVARTAIWAAHGLSMMPVAVSGSTPGYASTSVAPRAGEPFEYRVTVGALADVAALKAAMDSGDDRAMGRLLGFPRCCIEFFRKTWVEHACVDTTWAMAVATAPADSSGRRIDIPPSAPFQANILWRWMGVRAVPHLPCSFSCPSTVKFANTLMDLGRQLGFADEMAWIEEILDWPASWSALHGIAQIKTPVLKTSTRTDATGHEFVVNAAGRRMPREAATGLTFPFKPPEKPALTHSVTFVRGLDQPIAASTPLPAWYASDNGFSTRAAMDEAHRPIVQLAVSTLGETGIVLDLGCGNGALLKKIHDARPNVVPFGLDTEEWKLEHARELQPHAESHFVLGNMFNGVPLDPDTLYSLILLMPGRLLEVDQSAAQRLKGWLRDHFQYLLVYAYGEWLTRHGGLAGLAEKTGLELTTVHSSGSAGLARIVG
ncbi:MAG TPA: hypothetical protein VF219_06280, partial [Vicinamibacterales bacterium]